MLFCLFSLTGFGVRGEGRRSQPFSFSFCPSCTALSCQPSFLWESQRRGDKPVTEYVLACTAQTIYRWGEGGAGCGASEGKKREFKEKCSGLKTDFETWSHGRSGQEERRVDLGRHETHTSPPQNFPGGDGVRCNHINVSKLRKGRALGG